MKRLKFISFILLFLATVIGVGQLLHVSASESHATVNVDFTSVFDGENAIESNLTNRVFGSKLSLDLPEAPSGHTFAFWVVNGVVRSDLPVDHQFVVTSTLDIVAVFRPSNKFAVLFMDANGKRLDTQYVANEGAAVDPSDRGETSITLPNKPGLVVATPKWKTLAGQTSLVITNNTVFVLQYQTDIAQTFTLTINNGSSTTTPTYNYNEVATIVGLESYEGKPFSHWEENGYTASTEQTYSFTMLSDRELTAVYSLSPKGDTPRVVISNDLGIRGGHQTYLGQFYLPNNYELIEYGVLHHSTAEVLTFDTDGVTRVQSNKRTADTNEFLMSFTKDTQITARAYLVVKSNSTIQTFFSNNHTVFYEDFENLSSLRSYPTSDLETTLGGLLWIVKEVLNPSTADTSDKFSSTEEIHGTNMLRFRGANTAYIILNEYQDYISTITFEAKYYNASHDTSVMKLWKQVIGSEWTLLDTVVLSDSYQSYKFEILESNVRVKITVDGKSANLDNLRLQTFDRNVYYDITFNNEGSTSTSSAKEARYLDLPEPTKTGHSFGGWYLDDEFVTLYDGETLVNDSFTLYAKWVINQYTISFNSDGGSSADPITANYGSAVSKPTDPTRTDYDFDDWYISAESETPYEFSTMPADNITLIAKWTYAGEATSYTVTFNSNGGSTTDSAVVLEGGTVSKPTDPTKTSYTFYNWYTDELLLNLYDFDEVVTGDFTLYAKWVNSYIETFDNSAATASYLDGSFVGVHEVTWSYGHSRNEDTFAIEGKGLMLRRASDSYLEATFANGVGRFSFEYRKAFTGTSVRQLEVIVNGVQIGTTPEFGTTEPDPTVYKFEIDINEEGPVTIRIKNVGTTTTNRQTILDNIYWTEYNQNP